MKNTVFLKNIKSNLVEEAIVVFKENVKIKEKQFVKGKPKEESDFNEKVAIKEAEGVILDYIDECEKAKKENIIKKKILALKVINVSLVILLIISIFF